MKKAVMLLIFGLSALVLFANGGPDSAGMDEGVTTITILCVTSPETEALKAAAKEFQKLNPGYEIIFNEQGRLGYFTNVTTQLVGGTDEFDLVQDNTTYMTELAAAGVLEPWDDYLNNPELTDLDAYDLDDLPVKLIYDGKIYCIPTDLSSQVYYYRKDLIDEPAETWDDLLRIAKANTGTDQTSYGAMLTALTGSPAAPKIFYTVLWSYGGDVIDKNGKVVINSEAARKAAEVYRALKPYMPEDITTYNYPKVFDALKAGSVAQTGPFWNAAWLNMQLIESEFKDKYGIALIPGVRQTDGSIYRTPQTHGWGLVMNAKSKNKIAAWKFLKFATSVEGFKIRGVNGGSIFRPSILSDPANSSDPYFSVMAETYAIAKMEPLVPYYTKMHEILNQMLADILTTDKSIDDILEKTEQNLINLQARYE